MTAPHRRWFLLALAGLPLLLISAAVALGPRLPNPALAAVEPPSPPTADPAPAKPGRPVAADGRHYPLVPIDPQVVADLLVSLEEALRSADTAADSLPALGHQHQVIMRVLAVREAQAQEVRRLLPPRWQPVLDHHLGARRAFLSMRRRGPGSATLPAWRIVAPEPAENLLRYYRRAAAATGIDWEVLAAVNLVETGMGRIDGVSVADARGPMQFLPTTWAQPGVGKGNIRDPHDAIHAAARYLVRRGGLKDIRKGLWGYNNSDYYGKAVLHYAALLREDPAAYTGLYHWEIHFASNAGDLWLPVGYAQTKPMPVALFLQSSPVSAPPAVNGGS
ncbi:lytic transglycosylase domain-containing protein [Synechococcus sp. CS-1329]|uniref:lytic transglycosylase domain-containing protein n=1 Tax=Synechococcus sp. CS-1329 TaxID=2847975 RepID=UPI00223AADF7|nr:lytic transglycosylase domain-containing protein [Synechococcus sp. CS-1329]MCT0219972.1 lytic transglycosylase domain-containing protein [Synechococcus sp. CS-1329]